MASHLCIFTHSWLSIPKVSVKPVILKKHQFRCLKQHNKYQGYWFVGCFLYIYIFYIFPISLLQTWAREVQQLQHSRLVKSWSNCLRMGEKGLSFLDFKALKQQNNQLKVPILSLAALPCHVFFMYLECDVWLERENVRKRQTTPYLHAQEHKTWKRLEIYVSRALFLGPRQPVGHCKEGSARGARDGSSPTTIKIWQNRSVTAQRIFLQQKFHLQN